MYPTLRLIHLQVHLQMSSRSCKIYDRNSTKENASQIQCKLSRKRFTVQLIHRVWHNRQLLSGPPHPPQLHLEERQQKKVNPVQEIPHKVHLEPCMHVHQPVSQVCKPGESLALRKVKHPLNGRTSVSRLPLIKQDILSQYSGCFEGIGCFPGDPYKFHLKPEHKPARHALLRNCRKGHWQSPFTKTHS